MSPDQALAATTVMKTTADGYTRKVDPSGSRETNETGVVCGRKEGFRLAVPILQGCCNKQVRLYSSWVLLLAHHFTQDEVVAPAR